ncbi:MAG TPA: hypothetical protein VGN56_01065 [Candidatus Paceibacterota bacterium]|nr:hypothetical protein [Candidatus Paceibacterota bacterium]
MNQEPEGKTQEPAAPGRLFSFPPFAPVPLLERFRKTKSARWSAIQGETLLKLFNRVAKRVPAYTEFLKQQGISASEIRTTEDLNKVPAVSKKNYLHSNAFADLFWDKSLRSHHILTSTSGSTGKPTYFARTATVDEQSSQIHELIFSTSSLDERKSTLVIVCFGMGVWIGGLITYQAFDLLARRGYPISILTPGINKAEILKTLRDLAPQYQQIVIAGYPPFLKDVIDDAVAQGTNFKKHSVMLLFAAEAFTERFRDHVAHKAGIENVLTDTANIYGSADLGTMAFETPLSILARRLATKDKKLFNTLFKGTMKTPTLAQYVPSFVTFEESEGQLLISGDSAIPLVRYAIGDHGGVYTFAQMIELCAAHGIDLMKEAHDAGIAETVLELPFVYVYERADLATTLYGLQIYPETIKEVLLNEQFHSRVTGKLTLITKFDQDQDQYVEVNVELKPGAEANVSFNSVLVSEIVRNLREKNSEYHELYEFIGARAEPRVVTWPYEDPLYFKPGTKQSWVLRTP